MKDAKGNELKIGDKIILSIGGVLTTATINKLYINGMATLSSGEEITFIPSQVNKLKFTVNDRVIEEYATRIRNWEIDAGEGFLDYFMDDMVNEKSWAFWLIGKGYVERGNYIIEQCLKNDECTFHDMEMVYHIAEGGIKYDAEYDTHYVIEGDADNDEDNIWLNAKLWAEFLISTEYYRNMLDEWLDNGGCFTQDDEE